MNGMHLSQARRIMNADNEFSIEFLTEKGEMRKIGKAVSLKYSFQTGTRTIKCIPSNQIRRIRDVLIYRINDIEVFL